MAKHALSALKKRNILSQSKDRALRELLDQIDVACRDALRRQQDPPKIKPLIRQYNSVHGTKIAITTIYRHLANPNAETKQESAAKRQLLTPAEEMTLLAHIHDMVARAQPPCRSYIERAALEIVHSRDPSLVKIGINWMERFKARHQEVLVTAWTKSLDTSRAAAVNPTNIKHYYDLLEAVMRAHLFTEENTYGFDETGCPFGGDETKERVYAAPGASVQHKQSEGNRENVTAMVTICGDGTYLTPIAIFKGKNMRSAWHAANTLLRMR